MTGALRRFFLPLIFARRDMRAGLKGFYVFLACLVLGVAAIASIQSVSRGLIESLHHDGRYILGGDIALRTIYEPATPEQRKFLNTKIGVLSVVMETRAMARSAAEKVTLAEVKAVDLFYPLYGALEVVDEAGTLIKTPLQDLILAHLDAKGDIDENTYGALVEKELLTRLGAHIGDWIRLGEKKFQVRGIIAKEPDRIGSMHFSLAPRLMISLAAFDQTGLKKAGSQIYYDQKVLVPYIHTFDDLHAVEERIKAAFPNAAWKGRDFLNVSPQVQRMIERLTLFLTLIGLTTLLIGGVGISNAVRSFLDSRLSHIATLKSLGGSDRFITHMYMAQIFVLATLGIALGLAAGVSVSYLAGALLTARLSLTDQTQIFPSALLLAAGYGYLTTLCFSLWPIGRAVRVSPTDLFRDLVSPQEQRPALSIVLWIVIAAQALALLAVLTASDQRLVFFFVVSAVAVFAIFYGYAALVKAAARRFRAGVAPEVRMAVANLHRPGNVTGSVILSLGLGLTVLIAVALVQYNFTRLINNDLAIDAPSFFFLDIRPDQRDDFRRLLADEPSARGLVMMPSFRGRIIKVNGTPAEEALKDPNENWVINSDRGFTYTADLPAYSRVVAGTWWDKNYSGSPIVSIATNVARAFNIGVGDSITVNILGSDITARVANVREVDWSSFTMNFAITFAPGFLEKAPANYLGTAVVAKGSEEAVQQKIAHRFENVTIVRVGDALAMAQTIVRAVAQAVSISAAVTLLAGTLVLAGGIAAARRRHLYDAIILKVLGATQGRILKTFLLEYALLGLLTVVIAAALGTLSAYAVQIFVMDLNWKFDWIALLGVTALCLGITLISGFLGTWRALRQKPAPYLRNL